MLFIYSIQFCLSFFHRTVFSSFFSLFISRLDFVSCIRISKFLFFPSLYMCVNVFGVRLFGYISLCCFYPKFIVSNSNFSDGDPFRVSAYILCVCLMFAYRIRFTLPKYVLVNTERKWLQWQMFPAFHLEKKKSPKKVNKKFTFSNHESIQRERLLSFDANKFQQSITKQKKLRLKQLNIANKQTYIFNWVHDTGHFVFKRKKREKFNANDTHTYFHQFRFYLFW